MYTYGYIRVSSRDQNEDRQRIAMREAGVEDARIYMDKQSGNGSTLLLSMDCLTPLLSEKGTT